MSSIKIFVSHSPDSHNIRPEMPFFYHITAGSDLQTEPLPGHMLQDNTGDHISYKNRSFCELTVQYWAWKNTEADYYGFCHYRRYFSFAPEKMRQADCGCLVFPYFNRHVQALLCMDAEAVCRKAGQHDVLIAEGIPVHALGARSVADHYRKAPGLNIRDLQLFYKILVKKYPELAGAAACYLNGSIFYPCNMFIMKKELFVHYCDMLFTVLEEFERRADMGSYSREAYRTPGHLGERFAGIYFTYLGRQGGYRLGELQMAMIGNAQAETYEKPARNEINEINEIPVVFAADKTYLPMLCACLRSLVNCADPDRNYHIYILHTELDNARRQAFLKAFLIENVRVEFVDVGPHVYGYRLRAKEHITKETYYRFLILDLFKDCQKVVYLDTDIIVRRDIAQLYDTQLGDCLIAAAADADFAGQCNGANMDTAHYCAKVLKLSSPSAYVQAGVIVFHVSEMRKTISVRKLMRMAEHGNYMYSDQDILNIVCQGRIKLLDMAWNVMADSGRGRADVIRQAPRSILQDYERARKDPYIIHYCGSTKPWKYPGGDFAEEFWMAARQTPYYEQLLGGIAGQEGRDTVLEKTVGMLRNAAKKILPQGSRIRRSIGRLYWKLK